MPAEPRHLFPELDEQRWVLDPDARTARAEPCARRREAPDARRRGEEDPAESWREPAGAPDRAIANLKR